MPSMYDWTRPSIARYVDAILALSPAEWDRLAVEARRSLAGAVLARARRDGHPAPHRALPPRLRPYGGWRAAAVRVLEASMATLEDASLAPAWQRHGTGPARLIYERLQHPYVLPQARRLIDVGLMLLWGRPYRPEIRRPPLLRVTAVLRTVLPWDAIWATPDADGTTGRPEAPVGGTAREEGAGSGDYGGRNS